MFHVWAQKLDAWLDQTGFGDYLFGFGLVLVLALFLIEEILKRINKPAKEK